ncbi:unnamed protein product [Parnassius apollo]|uniref:(apollo) hypothetical protein n=1 Tax=Parnassius apollo TaxID=110799 RepID=A0A8S3XN24_PARAO|nr:unnamed protein product [Parnassius apollo]
MASQKRGKILQTIHVHHARDIVYNVIKYFDGEKNLECYNPLKCCAARAAMAINLSMTTISKIKKEGREIEIEDFIISVGMNSDSEDESDDYEDQNCESDQSMEVYDQLMEGIEPIMGSDDPDTAGLSGL